MTGIGDPLGTTRASRFTNTSSGTLTITQTVPVPGFVTCAFSAFLRASSGGSGFAMVRTDGSTTTTDPVSPGGVWSRFSLGSTYASSISTSCDFSLVVPSGTTVDVFGMQVEAQPSAGLYVVSTSETAVYPNSRFDSNELKVTGTGPNQSSIQFSIFSKASQ